MVGKSLKGNGIANMYIPTMISSFQSVAIVRQRFPRELLTLSFVRLG